MADAFKDSSASTPPAGAAVLLRTSSSPLNTSRLGLLAAQQLPPIASTAAIPQTVFWLADGRQRHTKASPAVRMFPNPVTDSRPGMLTPCLRNISAQPMAMRSLASAWMAVAGVDSLMNWQRGFRAVLNRAARIFEKRAGPARSTPRPATPADNPQTAPATTGAVVMGRQKNA